VQLRRALRHEAAGDRERALAAVRAAIEDCDTTLTNHPELAGAFNNRAACRLVEARLLAAGGDATAALGARALAGEDLRRAVLLEPDLADALFNWGVFLLRDAATPIERLQASALLRRALDGAPRGWPHVRAATELLRESALAER
jgi:tetratricopeptide (TPR) repeat protein